MSPLITSHDRSMVLAGTARPRQASLLLFLAATMTLSLAGCLAQHADVKRLRGSLDHTITALEERDQALEAKLAQAEARIDRQRKHAEHLFRVARARSKQDVRELRDQDLAVLTGKLEETGSVLAHSRQRLDGLQHRLASLTDALATHQREIAQRRAAAGQVSQETVASLQAEQQSLRQALAGMQESVRTELEQLFTYVQALKPTLEGLVEKVDRRLQEQEEAIAANAAATEALHLYLTRFRAALVGAIPTLNLPPGEPPGGITTAPSKTE